jgi:septum site-determining protein MinC
MALLRGSAQGLQITFDSVPLEDSLTTLSEVLTSQPDFYRGSSAHVIFRAATPSRDELQRVIDLLQEAEISVESLMGDTTVATLAEEMALPYNGVAPPVSIEDLQQRRRTNKLPEPRPISDSARSLVADFAGARADMAARRTTATVTQLAPATLYQRGTIRSGQIVRHLGNVVIVGDVNPGAEIIASGDIVIFGILRGQAHAGAQGDDKATVTALELNPTQLRIATFIATGERSAGKSKTREGGEVARVEEDRIVVIPLSKEAT